MAAEKHQMIQRAITVVTYQGHSLADCESQALDQPTPIVKKSLVSISPHKSQRIHMVTPSRRRRIKPSTFRVVFHQDISPQIHRAEMDGKINILELCQFLNDAERQVLQVIGIQVSQTQGICWDLPKHLIHSQFSSTWKSHRRCPKCDQSFSASRRARCVQIANKARGEFGTVTAGVLPCNLRTTMAGSSFTLNLNTPRATE